MEHRVILFRFPLQTDGAILCDMQEQWPCETSFTRLKLLNDSSCPMCFWPCLPSVPLCYLALTLTFSLFSPSLYLLLTQRDGAFQYQMCGVARWPGGLDRQRGQESIEARMKTGVDESRRIKRNKIKKSRSRVERTREG